MPVLVDTNVIIDIIANDPEWGAWAGKTLHARHPENIFINPTIFAEISSGAKNLEAVETILARLQIGFQETPKEALFLAGQAFRKYRSQGGSKSSPLPDFFIGAHASILGCSIITRDVKRYRTYFPEVPLIHP